MRTLYVVFDFIRCPYTEKIVKGKNVYAKMTGNPNFPSPDVELSLLKSATDRLENYYVASLSGDKGIRAKLHNEVKDWVELMRNEAKYVERIAKNDLAILLSSGFNPAKPPIPGPRAEFSVKRKEKPGSVLLRRKALKNGYAYIWQYCINVLSENESDWTYGSVTVQASCLLSNLISATRYWFRVAVVTPKGISAYSNPIMHVMQ